MLAPSHCVQVTLDTSAAAVLHIAQYQRAKPPPCIAGPYNLTLPYQILIYLRCNWARSWIRCMKRHLYLHLRVAVTPSAALWTGGNCGRVAEGMAPSAFFCVSRSGFGSGCHAKAKSALRRIDVYEAV